MSARPLSASLLILAPTCLVASALATDLTVGPIEVTQTIQNAGQTLVSVARNPTIVRVKVAVSGSAGAVPGVDAELRVYANGVEIAGSPFFSSNGPISAPLAPNSLNENDTLNFFVSPPQSTDVDFVVTVNPLRTVEETDYANNTGSFLNRNFQCRKMVDLAYISVNYTPGGGQPNQATIEPGMGDAFLRGIFKTGDWNYHRSPLGALTWTQNINTSNNQLLTTINDIRNNQIPAAGYAKPEFIYAWLPGNPYSGNGQAIGIPGAAAFGNTEASRFQRTFAHEIGHCWGQPHNSQNIGTVGYDVAHQLKEPLNLGPIMPTTQKDIMVAGLLTHQAWVAQISFNDCVNDARSQCTGDEGGGANDGGAPELDRTERCLRIAGVYDHVAGAIALEPSQRFDAAEPTIDDPRGDAALTAYDVGGRVLATIRMRTGTNRERCSGDGLEPTSVFYALLPETIANASIARIEVKDVKSGRMLARQDRSPNAPVGSITSIGSIGGGGPVPGADAGPVDPIEGEASIQFTASDPDGGRLVATLLYSPDGGNRWAPVVQNHEVQDGDNEITFPTRNLPRSEGPNGIFKLRVSDDLNNSDSEYEGGVAFGAGSPPDVHIISPNTNITVPQWSSIVLQGSAWDMEDELLPESSVEWSSSLQGVIGTGRLFTSKVLVPGTHVLTLTGTDADGMSNSRQVTVTVTPRSVRSADLTFDGVVDGADLAVMLGAWGGNDLADLDLDGQVGPSDLAVLLGAWD